MGCLGVHFALAAEEVANLKSFESDSDRLEYLQEQIEVDYFEEYPDLKAESDKAWDAMHRLLGDGDLSYYTGPEPLRFAVIGGEPLHAEGDYIMSLKTPDQVKKVAAAVSSISKEEFKTRYFAIDEAKYGFPKSEEDCEYTWGWFSDVVTLFHRAAAEDRYVLFTANQ
jgi:hypothetical protein